MIYGQNDTKLGEMHGIAMYLSNHCSDATFMSHVMEKYDTCHLIVTHKYSNILHENIKSQLTSYGKIISN